MSSSTVLMTGFFSWSPSLALRLAMNLVQLGSMTSAVQKYSSCCTKTSILALSVHARRFQISSARLAPLWAQLTPRVCVCHVVDSWDSR